MHAVIEVGGPDDITLIDLGNEPGTMVNGARVNKCKLRVNDEIQVGGTKIVLERAGAPGTEMAAAAEPRASASPPLPPPPPPPPSKTAPSEPPRAPAPAPPAPEPAAANPFAPAGGANPFGAPAGGLSFSGFGPINPFAAGAAMSEEQARAAALRVPDDAPPGTYTYTLIKSGPDVFPEEVELPHVQSVEVMILWETNVLHVSHLTPPRSFYVGEEMGKNLECDFFIPAEKLGTTRMPLVVGDRTGVSVVMPAGAKGTIELPRQPPMTLDEARLKAQPSAEVSGGHQVPLPPGAKARIELGMFVFQVAAVNAGKPMPAGVAANMDWTVASYFGLSLLAHAGLIAAMAFFVPPLGLTDDEEIDKEQLYLIQQYLKSAAER
ncbi:MAG: FHA domain-containing protein, partial [Gemmatimonadota bacterium]